MKQAVDASRKLWDKELYGAKLLAPVLKFIAKITFDYGEKLASNTKTFSVQMTNDLLKAIGDSLKEDLYNYLENIVRFANQTSFIAK